ncbi:MAG: methylenetetrahydrofolate--tRNA-(uracil-5-)-methyltransferase [Thermoproteota archaeon]|jgi:methylenetetrahydrofolate--tRNA-(uracil-5-)-methyltransferase
MNKKVLIIGAGLAGCDAAFYLANKGIKVVLLESKVLKPNPSQKLKTYAELVCTNSMKSLQPESAHGLLKLEMEAFNSIIIKLAKEHAVPAGDALAVNRETYSVAITEAIQSHENIETYSIEALDPKALMKEYECDDCIISTGPLTTDGMAKWIQEEMAQDDLYFYDAIAPVVDADTLDYDKMYFKDRWKDDAPSADYLNAPMTKEQYYAFVEELRNAEKVPSQDFEDFKFFESCLPVDTMAERGIETPRFSCMKPKGLMTKEGWIPYAVVQLRKENLLGSAFNLVGFQTRLTYKEQVRVFKMIPGLENASFIHLGSIHRNSFLNARKLLNFDLSSKEHPNIYFAGQITGVEGYTESASMGLYVALQIERKYRGKEPIQFPVATAMGALVNYIMTIEKPVPSNINFGLLPSMALSKEQRKSGNKKKVRKALVSAKAVIAFNEFLEQLQ